MPCACSNTLAGFDGACDPAELGQMLAPTPPKLGTVWAIKGRTWLRFRQAAP
jgi:hypothetical protein